MQHDQLLPQSACDAGWRRRWFISTALHGAWNEPLPGRTGTDSFDKVRAIEDWIKTRIGAEPHRMAAPDERRHRSLTPTVSVGPGREVEWHWRYPTTRRTSRAWRRRSPSLDNAATQRRGGGHTSPQESCVPSPLLFVLPPARQPGRQARSWPANLLCRPACLYLRRLRCSLRKHHGKAS